MNLALNREELRKLFSIRDTLARSTSLDSLVEASIRFARQYTGSQTASLFLISKDGVLERKGFIGSDRFGREIDRDWFLDERHSPGESFTGKVLLAKTGHRFGEPQWTAHLQRAELNAGSYDRYLVKLGSLSCAAAIPLNGSTRTYGVLEIINKTLDQHRSPGDALFTISDLHWLSLIGITTAASLSSLRQKDQLALHTQISHAITRPLVENEEPQTSYERVASQLTGPFTSYKACIIRLGTSPDMLEITARGGDNISWEGRTEPPGNPGTLYGEVLKTGESIQVKDIEAESGKFMNIEWIRANRLRGYGCFPITLQTRVIGALSLYTGYPYSFEAHDVAFIESTCSLLASLADTYHAIGALHLDDADLENERIKYLGAARAVAYDRIETELRHSHKDFLQRLARELRKIRQEVPGRVGRVLDQQLKQIDEKVDETFKQFATAAHSRMNVDHIVQSVVKYFSRELRNKHIDFSLDLGHVPDIDASEVELRDLVVNLVSNAVKAIEAAGRRSGEIQLCTRVTASEKREVIEIEVKDNGSGVRKEDLEQIFEPGFTRYEGGTGMGLFIARGIANNYGGTIVVESTLGKGSRFIVRLPLQSLQVV